MSHAPFNRDTMPLKVPSSVVRSKMEAKLSYIIEFVADMDRAVKFYRDVIGLALKF